MASQDIVIGIKTQFEGDMGKTLDTLNTKVKDVTTSVDKLGDAEEKTGKQSKDASKSFKSTADEIRKGIIQSTLYVEGLRMLKDAFMSNQVVADALNGVMEGLNIIFQQVVGVIIDAVKQTYEASNGFEGLFAVMKGGITIALTPLKAAFYGIKLAIAEVQLLWEKSPFGSGDDKRIKELTADVDAAAESLKQVGVDAVNAGVDIVTNIGKAVDEVGSVITKSVEGIKKISIEGALAQGKALVDLENNAKRSEAQAQRLNAQYETQAEKLRQIRDDDTKSIAERTKANQDLEIVLNQQEQTLLKNAQIQVDAAQARKNANNTIENQVALTNALAQKEQVLADIEGKRSEQKANEVALRKEGIELTNAEKSSETELALKRRENTTNRIKDEVDRLKQQKLDLEESKRIELERLQSVIDSTTAGTLARVEAEKEYALKKEELDNAILVKQDEIDAKILQKSKETKEKQLAIEQAKFDAQIGIATNYVNAIGSLTDLVTSIRMMAAGNDTKAQEKAARQQFNIMKGVQIAIAIISGISGVQNALMPKPPGTDLTPEPFATALRISTAVGVGLASAANIAKIAAAQFQGGGGGIGPGPSTAPPPTTSSAPPAPSTIGLGQMNVAPQKEKFNWQKVYVVESDIRNTTNRVEVIENRSVLGS
jgi:hypothetical protein